MPFPKGVGIFLCSSKRKFLFSQWLLLTLKYFMYLSKDVLRNMSCYAHKGAMLNEHELLKLLETFICTLPFSTKLIKKKINVCKCQINVSYRKTWFIYHLQGFSYRINPNFHFLNQTLKRLDLGDKIKPWIWLDWFRYITLLFHFKLKIKSKTTRL